MQLLPALDRNGARVVEGDKVVAAWDNPLGRVSAIVRKVDGVLIEIVITHEKGLPIQQSKWPSKVQAREWVVLR